MAVFEPGEPGDVDMAPERLDMARQMVHEHVASGRTPTAAAVVARRGRLVLAEAAGVAAPDGPPLTLEHLWPLASASKPYTAATLMSLVEEGSVGIFEPIVELLPELAGGEHDDVLLHHLLTHTPGWESPMFTGRIVRFLGSGELTEPPPGRDPWSHLFLSLAFEPIRDCAPGEQMAYANVNYELLAEIIRRVTGRSLAAAIQERILEPLGLGDTTVVPDGPFRERLVERATELPYGSLESPPGGLDLNSEMFRLADSGGAGVFATPGDLAAFGQMVLNGGHLGGSRVLSPATVASMVTNQIPGTPAVFGGARPVREASWGYGFSVICEERWPYFGGGLVPNGAVTHPGAGGVNYWIDPEHELVGVFVEVLTRVSGLNEPLSGLSHRFQDVVTGAVIR